MDNGGGWKDGGRVRGRGRGRGAWLNVLMCIASELVLATIFRLIFWSPFFLHGAGGEHYLFTMASEGRANTVMGAGEA